MSGQDNDFREIIDDENTDTSSDVVEVTGDTTVDPTVADANKDGQDDYEDICDELILIASRKYLDHGNVISPQFPILIMLDLIYSYYLEHDKKKKETMHDDTVRALKGERS